jgi:hypothetical protein
MDIERLKIALQDRQKHYEEGRKLAKEEGQAGRPGFHYYDGRADGFREALEIVNAIALDGSSPH